MTAEAPTILRNILTRKVEEVTERRAAKPLAHLEATIGEQSPPRGFCRALQQRAEAGEPDDHDVQFQYVHAPAPAEVAIPLADLIEVHVQADLLGRFVGNHNMAVDGGEVDRPFVHDSVVGCFRPDRDALGSRSFRRV